MNEDLVAHWGYDSEDGGLESYTLIAVELRNASHHLAPVVASIG